MNILHYLPSLHPARGGPVRAVTDLSKGLARRGHRVTLLTTEMPDRTDEFDTVELVSLGGPGVNARPFSAEQRASVIRHLESNDMCHVHGVWDFSNTQISAACRQRRIPYFVSLRGMLDDWCVAQKPLKKRLFHTLLGRRHLERAAAVHCTAQGELDQSAKWFPNGRGVVIPNLLDLNPFRSPPGPELARRQHPMLTNGRPNVLFLSRVHYKKGVDVLIDAAALLKARGVACNTIIAGTGDDAYTSEMKARVRSAGLDDEVVFVGHVGGDAKVSLYSACDLFALPTSQENFGFVFPEALASGTPVITTKGVDIWPELLGSGAASIIDRTPMAFADEIGAILADPARREAMRAKAKPFVFSAFDEEALLDRYEIMYNAGTPGAAVRPPVTAVA